VSRDAFVQALYVKSSWTEEERLIDPADGGTGWIDPDLNSEGYPTVRMGAHIGRDVIEVNEFTPATPEPAAAKALLLQQYDSLKKSA
jgi:hypothetical protein